MTADTYEDPPTRAELSAELGLAVEPRFRRRSLAAGYGGLRVDEFGYEADATYHPSLDGGGQDG